MPGAALPLEFKAAETAADFVDDPFFFLGVPGGEGDAEADVGSGVIPGDGGDEVFGDHPLAEGFGVGEVDGLARVVPRVFGGGDVEKEGAARFMRLKSGGVEDFEDGVDILARGGGGDGLTPTLLV